MNTKTRGNPVFIVLIILTLAFIWGNSLMPGNVSAAISDGVKHLLFLLFGNGATEPSGSGILRKLAHFTEFAVLGVELSLLTRHQRRKTLSAVLLSGLTVAVCDETIQLFVANRGSSVRDVWIDFSGFLLGVGVVCLLLHLLHPTGRQT